MLSKEIIISRLALIKHLYNVGVEQSKQTETLSAFSILSFHDSIEMFLKLAAEHLSIKSDNFKFLEYWDHIPSLTLKESMRNLNARRVNIKHKGLLPSKSDVEISRVNTIDFFEQNTQPIFDIYFKDVSLLTLISYSDVKIGLEKAQSALNANRIEECIELAAFAFDDLINNYSMSKSSGLYAPFFFGQDMTFISSFLLGINRHDKTLGNLSEFIDKTKESIVSLQDVIKIISFGIDYRRFVKFKLLTPLVTRTIGGRQIGQVWGKRKWTKENCQYCINFVLDSSIKLQEFDFSIDELHETSKSTHLF